MIAIIWFDVVYCPIPLPSLPLFAPESLYQTEVTGVIGRLVSGKRGEMVTRRDQVDRVMHPLAYCCEGWCLMRWKEELGPNMSRAIVCTERHAYAAMCETSRQEHYQRVLRDLLRYRTGVATNGEGIVRTGKSL